MLRRFFRLLGFRNKLRDQAVMVVSSDEDVLVLKVGPDTWRIAWENLESFSYAALVHNIALRLLVDEVDLDDDAAVKRSIEAKPFKV